MAFYIVFTFMLKLLICGHVFIHSWSILVYDNSNSVIQILIILSYCDLSVKLTWNKKSSTWNTSKLKLSTNRWATSTACRWCPRFRDWTRRRTGRSYPTPSACRQTRRWPACTGPSGRTCSRIWFRCAPDILLRVSKAVKVL